MACNSREAMANDMHGGPAVPTRISALRPCSTSISKAKSIRKHLDDITRLPVELSNLVLGYAASTVTVVVRLRPLMGEAPLRPLAISLRLCLIVQLGSAATVRSQHTPTDMDATS